jgi:hypothetical protein
MMYGSTMPMPSEFDSTPMTRAEEIAIYRDAVAGKSTDEVKALVREMRAGRRFTDEEVAAVLMPNDDES